METVDYIYLSGQRFSDLRNQFHDLWTNEPIKLNAFISQGELAFYDLKMTLLTEQLYTITIKFHYSKKQKKLICEDEQNGYHCEVKDMHVIVDNYHNPTHHKALQNDIIVGYEDTRAKTRLWNALQIQKKTPADWAADLAIVFYMINLIAISLPNKLKERVVKANKTVEVKKNGKSTYKSVVYLERTIYLDKDFKLTKRDVTHIIKCPAWGVRGHYRHMKSGLLVYVKPYVKGKQRKDFDKYVGKEYRLGIE